VHLYTFMFAVAFLFLSIELEEKAPHARTVINCCRLFVVFVHALLLAGLRPPNLGSDTPTYVFGYNNLVDFASAHDVGEAYFGNTEILFWPFQALFKFFGVESQTWLAINFSIVFFLVLALYAFINLRGQRSIFLFCLLFFTYEIVYLGNIMRQALAMPMVFMAVYFLYRRSFLTAAAVFFLATGFHWSALSFLLCVPISFFDLRSRKHIGIALLAAFAAGGLVASVVSSGWIEFAPIATKADFYTSNVSHVESIFATFNFWYCLLIAVLLVATRPSFFPPQPVVCGFVVSVLMVLAGTGVTDISERHMPYALLFSPVIFYSWARQFVAGLGLAEKFAAHLCLVAHALLGFAVLLQPSTKFTLGLD